MCRYNKYQTKQSHAHTYTCTNDSCWLVLGRVTTKECHPRPVIITITIKIQNDEKHKKKKKKRKLCADKVKS